jgi:hypothetical protein
MEQGMPVVVLDPMTPGTIARAAKGEAVGSYIS